MELSTLVNIRLPLPVPPSESTEIFGTNVCATSHLEVLQAIASWIEEPRSRYVCFCNVHMIMEGRDDPSYQRVVNNADLVTPDGMPVVWYLRKHGHPDQERVTGPDLMVNLLLKANEEGWRIGLLGGEPETLEMLRVKFANQYPNLDLAYSHSPPFREPTEREDAEVCNEIRKAGVEVLFVGLGCPKQERWMADHSSELSCVMLGVGAAFQFNSGQVKKAPDWIQRSGMEWFFRLCMEPRRLWKRYAKHNPRFIWLLCREMLTPRALARPSVSVTKSPK